MKTEMTYSYYLVSYIDILGITKTLESIRGLPTTDEQKKYYGETIERVDTFIRAFRLWPDRFLTSLRTDRPIPEHVPIDKHEEYRTLTTPIINHRCLSDFQVSYVSLLASTPAEHFRALSGIQALLAYTGLLFVFSLSRGFPLRGGIGIDTGFELQDQEVLGPALTRAYQLESKQALFPRVIVGDEVMQHLSQYRKQQLEDPIVKACSKLATSIGSSMLARDVDGYAFVDFLGPYCRELCSSTMDQTINGTNYTYEGVLREAFTFVKGEYSRMVESKESRNAYGYLGLINYFHHRLSDNEKLKSVLDI